MYRSVAKKYQDTVTFGSTTDGQVINRLVPTANDETTLIWLNDLEPQLYKGEYTLKALDAWISTHTMPHMPELNGGNWGAVTAMGKPIVCAVVASNKPEHKAYLETMKQVAVNNLDQFSFGWFEGSKFLAFVSDNGLPADRWPGFFVIDSAKNIHYEEATVGKTQESIEAFLRLVLDGKAEAKGPGSSMLNAAMSVANTMIRELTNNPWMLALVAVLLLVLVGVIAFACTMKDDETPAEVAEEKVKAGKQD